MSGANPAKGPWTHRFLVRFFGVIFGLLVFWLLGFVVNDLGTWPGPSYDDLETERLDPELTDREEQLREQIVDTERKIEDQQARQKLLRDSTSNSQRTMDQLLGIQRLSLEGGVTPSAEEQKALAESEQLFLDNQKQYQSLNEDVVQLNEQLRDLKEQQRTLQETLEEEREPIREEHESLRKRHRLLMATFKLSFLIPLLLVAGILLLKKRESAYALLIYAFGIAVVLKVGLVMHTYFPEEYFKYILILVLLMIVVRILVYLLRMIAFPKQTWLLKQYREAYESFSCPICGYPIRRGPLQYASWTRRSIRRLGVTPPAPLAEETAYTCPVCTTKLHEECEACHAIRPALLPACDKCGTVKPVDAAGGTADVPE